MKKTGFYYAVMSVVMALAFGALLVSCDECDKRAVHLCTEYSGTPASNPSNC